jgi:hypothetical protein
VPGAEWVYPHLPVFRIDAGGAAISALGWTSASLDVIRDHDGTLRHLDTAPVALHSAIGIQLHGSSSLGYPKLPYAIELRDPVTGADADASLVDLPADSDWILVPSYGDKTYVRNALSYGIARDLAEPAGRWEPHAAFCEVYVDDDYKGIYLLVEKVKRDSARLAGSAPSPDATGDLTGTYVVKVDLDRNPYFTTTAGTLIGWWDPDEDGITHDQDAYLRSYFDSFEAALQAPDFASTYPDWIDVDAWVDNYIVNELAHNIDAYRLSTYLWKQPDVDGGRLFAGPVWDFDRAWGNVNYCDCFRQVGYVIDDLTTCGYDWEFPFWWDRLRQDPAFDEAVACRWKDLRADLLTDDALDARIDLLVAQVAEAQPRDEDRWGTLGVNVGFNAYVGETWDDEVGWLKKWTHARTAWMDSDLDPLCPN